MYQLNEEKWHLSQQLGVSLKLLVGKTKYHVKNPTDFRKLISDLCVSDEIMNPLGVVSLFTNVPIQVVMDVIRDRLVKDKTLRERTDLSADNIMSLLKFVGDILPVQWSVVPAGPQCTHGKSSLSGGGRYVHGGPGRVRHEQRSLQCKLSPRCGKDISTRW